MTADELEMIAGLCREHDVIVVSDEVYEWLVYPPQQHIRIGQYLMLRTGCTSIHIYLRAPILLCEDSKVPVLCVCLLSLICNLYNVHVIVNNNKGNM